MPLRTLSTIAAVGALAILLALPAREAGAQGAGSKGDRFASRLLISRGPLLRAHDFLFTNERIWAGGLGKAREHGSVDLLIGFNTTANWDLAAATRAERLVIADWSVNPLRQHHYLFEAMFKVARSREDLLSIVTATPPQRFRASAFPLMIRRLRESLTPSQELPLSAERREFARSLERRISASPSITEEQKTALREYLGIITTGFAQIPRSPRHLLDDAPATPADNYGWLRILPLQFLNTYSGRSAKGRAAGLGLTAFASEASFKRVKRLLDDGLSYAHGSFDDPELYASAAAVLAQQPSNRRRRVLINISNIPDATACLAGACPINGGGQTDRRAMLARFKDAVRAGFAGQNVELVVLESHGTSDPFGYETYGIGSGSQRTTGRGRR